MPGMIQFFLDQMEEHQIQFVLEKLASKTKMAGAPENEAIIREKTPQPTNQES